mgnify:CR=1 FL=1
MSGKYRLSFAESAVSDLEAISEYYKEQGAPEAGRRIVEALIEQTEKLSIYPDIGRVVPEYDTDHLREVIYPPFRVVYRRDKSRVRIVRIWRSERLLNLPEE